MIVRTNEGSNLQLKKRRCIVRTIAGAALLLAMLLYGWGLVQQLAGVDDNEIKASSSKEAPLILPKNAGDLKKSLPLPLPVRVMEQYKQWHSVDSLRKNPQGRSFTLGYYKCPVSAGNRLHEFMNALLFSILTNRTLLWKYYDKDACGIHGQLLKEMKVPMLFELKLCSRQNALDECDSILTREAWLPSYDEWSGRLGLPSASWVAKNSSLDVTILPKLVVFAHETKSLDLSSMMELLPTEWARSTAKDLYSLGTAFTYGVAFRSLFDFSDRIKSSILPSTTTTTATGTFTVGVHSRHTVKGDDGCSVNREIHCLEQLIPPGQHPCTVYIMADRECTLSNIAKTMQTSRKCEVQVAKHEEESSFLAEHGPFAGAGFFQDLATASAGARHGVVIGEIPGERIRTSSVFLLELIEYNRRMEAWQTGQDPAKLRDVETCKYVELHTKYQRRANKLARNEESKD